FSGVRGDGRAGERERIALDPAGAEFCGVAADRRVGERERTPDAEYPAHERSAVVAGDGRSGERDRGFFAPDTAAPQRRVARDGRFADRERPSFVPDPTPVYPVAPGDREAADRDRDAARDGEDGARCGFAVGTVERGGAQAGVALPGDRQALAD